MSTTKFSIVKKIMSLLNLGEEGKLDSFFTKVKKRLEKEISILSKNLDTIKFNHDQEIEDLQDKLVDANENLDAAFFQVDPSSIQTNENQNSYIETYLGNIDEKLAIVLSLEKKIEKAKKKFENEKKEIEEQIQSNKTRLSIIFKED